MKTEIELQDEQDVMWNGPLAKAWVDTQEFMDNMLRPFETMLVQVASKLSPNHVLDIGCGNGSTTMAIADAIAPEGRCTGIDISRPMMENARKRSSLKKNGAKFICADAGNYTFVETQFDVFVSRFGVMFFADPVAAFSNLRRAARDEARLFFLVWRGPQDNDFLTAGQLAAAPLLPDPPPRDAAWPGPFSLSDADHARSIFVASGWNDVELQAIDLECRFKESDLDMFLNELMPIGQDVDEAQRSEIDQVVRSAYGEYVQDEEVRFTASSWMISAHAN